MSAIAEAIASIKARAQRATLIAVSKTRSVEEIGAALAAGQRIFGENRVQEARAKFPLLRETYPDIELHLIGPLQTNKALAAVELFDVIQTLDRPQLADALAKAIKKSGKTPRFFIEVNTGDEPQKAGISLGQLAPFLSYCRDICGLPVIGLMCIPPQGRDPSPFFLMLRDAAQNLKLPHISMGMSGDFETAVACGATDIRVGAAIFGDRKTP